MPQVKGRPTTCTACHRKVLYHDGDGFTLCLTCGEVLAVKEPSEPAT